MRVLIRVDGDRTIGSGHVMRMLALAERVAKAGGAAVFACARLDPALEESLTARVFELVTTEVEPGSPADAEWTKSTAADFEASWIVADSYAFDTDYQVGLRTDGQRLLFVDDHARCPRYSADLVLNQNVYASPRSYRDLAEGAELLLGSSFALLRREFLEVSSRSLAVPERAANVLVTMGGTDPANATERVARALQKLPDPMQVVIVLGPCNGHRELVERGVSDRRFRIVSTAGDMAAYMWGADLAIAAAGVTTYELCCMGVPSMLTVLADNQVEVARAMAANGAAEDMGWHDRLDEDAVAERVADLILDRERRRTMGEAGRALVDGRGASRVLEAMERYG